MVRATLHSSHMLIYSEVSELNFSSQKIASPIFDPLWYAEHICVLGWMLAVTLTLTYTNFSLMSMPLHIKRVNATYN